MSESPHNMFECKTIQIPDFVLPQDIPNIYQYFDYYNIANVKNVTFYDHLESEYNAEDKPYYGFAVIEIAEWYNNSGATNFYNSIINNNCKMVYDDPNYWDVEFYEQTESVKDADVANEQNLQIKIEEPTTLNKDNNNSMDSMDSSEFDSDSYSEFDSGSEQDDENDTDYIYNDSECDEDKLYEYGSNFNEFKQKNIKKSNKKRKLDSENKALKIENTKLRELLIQKNKNNQKNKNKGIQKNKQSNFKNLWAKRLRHKRIH